MPDTAHSTPDMKQPQKLLKEYFGYESFRPTQKKAIQAVLKQQDVFVLMPTGGGKSMCYQIPAMVMDGTAIVISPLIALMKDQVDGLRANGIAAAFLNSSQTSAEQDETIQAVLNGEIKILYVSAERLLTPEFSRLLQKISVSLFAVDEAHCISAWGHDFRPDYTNLSHLKEKFPKVPIIALTATADETTRKDILKQLSLHQPKQFIDSFDRPNITLTVLPGQKRIEKIKDFLKDKKDQSGIVYCLTRKQTESLAKKLEKFGLNAASYHAGLSSSERERIQKSFVLDKTQIICATIAFGMGIDKSNVRWVIHYNMPKNIEGYYQEIGRAGRDSAPAHALLFYSYADFEMIKKYFIENTQADLQMAKLQRMKEFSEGVICRRKILLGYFDEAYTQDCQNCDVCSDEYPSLNGTKITRLALRVLKNISENTSVDSNELVKALLPKSDKVRFASWHFYLAQMKNQGLLKVDFSQGGLHITEQGEQVLAGKLSVQLVTLDAFIERQEKASKSVKSTSKKKKKDYNSEEYNSPLFSSLRELRTRLASEHGIAAYMVFSDATLLEMVKERPQNKEEFLDISGVGAVKWDRFGEDFLEVILDSDI